MAVDSFTGKLAVVTGGGSGMGRELARQLVTQGCSVAACDVNADTAAIARAAAVPEVRVTSHACDVADEGQVLRFRDEVLEEHGTDHVDLVFSNAGIGGGSSFVSGDREEWERTFAIDWYGVYYCARAFLPLLIASADGVLVNTSSVNGFWASLGPGAPQTAYSTAKFAVRGFSEALIEDLRTHAPHVRVAVVMPGHVGSAGCWSGSSRSASSTRSVVSPASASRRPTGWTPHIRTSLASRSPPPIACWPSTPPRSAPRSGAAANWPG